MNSVFILCKRFYTNKDLVKDKFGRLFYLPKYWVEQDCRVTVVCLSYRDNQYLTREMDGVRFISIGIRGLNLLRFWSQVKKLAAEFQPDRVIASGDSYLGYLGWKLAQCLERPFVFDVYDYYEGFGTNRIPGFKWMFRQAVTHADLVFCASQPLQQYVNTWNSKTLLITNGVDPEIFRPLDQAQCRRQLDISLDKPVIGYFGSMEVERGMGDLLAACERLVRQLPGLTLLLAGRNSANWDFSADWIDYRGMRPQTEIPLLINACDLLVIPYQRGQVMDMGSSCKIAEYLGCQKKILATRTPNFFEAFPELSDKIIWVDSNEPDFLANTMAEALSQDVFYETGTLLGLSWKELALTAYQKLY